LAAAIEAACRNESSWCWRCTTMRTLTLKEIGHVLQVSESRVSQIHTKAIMTLAQASSAEQRRGAGMSIRFPDFQVLVSRSEQVP
jgi:hypothetical protein